MILTYVDTHTYENGGVSSSYRKSFLEIGVSRSAATQSRPRRGSTKYKRDIVYIYINAFVNIVNIVNIV